MQKKERRDGWPEVPPLHRLPLREDGQHGISENFHASSLARWSLREAELQVKDERIGGRRPGFPQASCVPRTRGDAPVGAERLANRKRLVNLGEEGR